MKALGFGGSWDGTAFGFTPSTQPTQPGSVNVTANEDGTWNSEIHYTAIGEVRWKDGITPTDYRYRAAQRSIQSEA